MFTTTDYVGGGDEGWRERMQTSGALGRIEAAYVQAINDAGPEVCEHHDLSNWPAEPVAEAEY